MAPKSRTKRTPKSAAKPSTRASSKSPASTTTTTSIAVEPTPSETTAVETTSIAVETTSIAVETTKPETTVVEITPPETTTVETTPPETTSIAVETTSIAVETTPPKTTAVETTPPETTAVDTALPETTTVKITPLEASAETTSPETADGSAAPGKQPSEEDTVDKTAVKPAVKKTIRVVKKVIKKKVVKRVPKLPSNEVAKSVLPPSVLDLIEVENPNKQSETPETEGSKPDSDVAQIDAPNADSVGTQINGCEESIPKEEVENSENGDGKEEEVENCEDGGHKEEEEKEEMEVSERRRRRKTEIFIGGLDKDAKEEDIRKVFEKIGEIVEVRLMKSNKTGKNKGYAFLRYALAADAKRALTDYPKVEVCGKLCGTAPVEVNDTIFLGNIDKKWKKEDIVKLLNDIGIEKIDIVTVMPDPNNAEYNRGFAFLELETNKDAQSAYKMLQKKDIFGKGRNIKVAWAEPLNVPDEEEMLKVKSVYAEGVPSSWDEEKVKKHFKKFGEIERVVLARNMHSARRKDFAFVNYTTREAALACIESINKECLTDEGTKVNVRASLAKPIPKGKQTKGSSRPSTKDHSKEKPKAAQRDTNLNASSNKGKSEVSYGYTRDRRSSTTHELTQGLREQASLRPGQIGLGIGYRDQTYTYPMPGGKRPLSALGDSIPYSDPRAYPRARLDGSLPVASSSYSMLSQGVSGASLPYYQQSISSHRSDSPYGSADHSGYLQTRLGAAPYGSGLYRRY